MKQTLLITILALLVLSCNRDNIAPTIGLSNDSFCAAPGDMIVLDIEIEEENSLTELRLLSTDLDFSEIIDGKLIEGNGGMISVVLTVADNTNEGNYELNVLAIDDSDNVATERISIKVQS